MKPLPLPDAMTGPRRQRLQESKATGSYYSQHTKMTLLVNKYVAMLTSIAQSAADMLVSKLENQLPKIRMALCYQMWD